MWPWEHVAVAYLAYSACSRVLYSESPTARGAVVVAVASLLPDLVDKPLAWWLAVLPAGRSLGHSALVGAPLVAVAAVLVFRVLGDRSVALALAVGYATHLLGDVFYPLVVKGELRVGFLLWPVVPAPTGGTGGALPHVQDLVLAFLAFLATPRGPLYLAGDVALVAAAVAVWLIDGHPGLAVRSRPASR